MKKSKKLIIFILIPLLIIFACFLVILKISDNFQIIMLRIYEKICTARRNGKFMDCGV